MAFKACVHIGILVSRPASKSEIHRIDSQFSIEILIILFCRCSVYGTTEQNREGTRSYPNDVGH